MLGSIEYLTELDLKCNYESIIALRNSSLENDSQVKCSFGLKELKKNKKILFRFFILIQEQYIGPHILKII